MSNPVVAGVIGWPIGHSRSPILHAHWLQRYGIQGHYVPLAVPPERLLQALRALPALGFAGVNVTVPHKQAAARIVDRLDEPAARTGSVNMVTVGTDGALEGASSDGGGFCASLETASPGLIARVKTVVMIGAGGAARAIADTLSRQGIERIRVINRTPEHASAFATEFGQALAAWPWSERSEALRDADLLINATSLGMIGAPPLDLDLGPLPGHAVVTDIVYAPLETALLTAARARGNRVVDGLGMLLHQARPAFRRWYGVDPVVDEALRAAVLAAG